MSAQEILSLVSRLETALAGRQRLHDKRRAMITQFRETGVKVDPWVFSEVTEHIKVNDQTIHALQTALDALRGAA